MQKILSIADKTPTYRLQDADTSTPFEFLPPSPLVSLYILLLSRFASLESRKRSRLPVFTRSRCGGIGWAGVSILNRHTFNHARLHVGQVGHVGQAASKSEAYQRFSPPDMAFPMSGACRACRACPTSRGVMRSGWKGMGRMRPVGGMERRAPRRTVFPMAAGFAGVLPDLWPPCGGGAAASGGLVRWKADAENVLTAYANGLQFSYEHPTYDRC